MNNLYYVVDRQRRDEMIDTASASSKLSFAHISPDSASQTQQTSSTNNISINLTIHQYTTQKTTHTPCNKVLTSIKQNRMYQTRCSDSKMLMEGEEGATWGDFV